MQIRHFGQNEENVTTINLGQNEEKVTTTQTLKVA